MRRSWFIAALSVLGIGAASPIGAVPEPEVRALFCPPRGQVGARSPLVGKQLDVVRMAAMPAGFTIICLYPDPDPDPFNGCQDRAFRPDRIFISHQGGIITATSC